MKKLIKSDCRICGSGDLVSVLDLGAVPLSGTFLKLGEVVARLPLNLARCNACGLVQLFDKLPIEELYSANYGYESHLNESMVFHLRDKATRLMEIINQADILGGSRVFLDIASNDGTLLREISKIAGRNDKFLGCDPLIANFVDYYPARTIKIPSFFSKENIGKEFYEKIDLITSLSVYYDVNNPVNFAKDIWHLLKPGGLWHLEQSYLPAMLENNSYDTICHEHLLYFSARDLRRIANEVGFSVLNSERNLINGGSLQITLQKRSYSESAIKLNTDFEELCKEEEILGVTDGSLLKLFSTDAAKHAQNLRRTVLDLKNTGHEIYALGASTKGNIILNFAELDFSIIKAIGEVNPKKYGKVTPGTNIPIIDEKEILGLYGLGKVLIILPWHFRETFLGKSQGFLKSGGKLLFPMPEIMLVGSENV